MSQLQVDHITASAGGGVVGMGAVAQKLLQNDFDVNSLRTHDVLQKDEWTQFDEVLIGISRRKLVAVSALASRNLTYSIANGLGTTILEWEKVGEMTPADVSMSGVTEGEKDRLTFSLDSMPLPIIHKDFSINIRALEASRTRGQPLDTAQIAMASTLVTETIESMVFNGTGMVVGDKRIYGLQNYPNRNTGAARDWAAAATTGEQKLDDIIAMVDVMQKEDMYGPYGMFIPNSAYVMLSEDYKANSDKTQLSRLLELPNIEFILPTKDLTGTNLTMVQLTNDVIDEVIGMQPTVVMWESLGGMQIHFKVMAIMAPRIRSTITKQCGIVHFA